MEEIILDKLVGENSLIDCTLKSILINTNKEGMLEIELIIDNFRNSSEYSCVKLRFKDVQEYNFYHNKDYYFYNIENLKFQMVGSNYYISLDPDDSSSEKSDDDADFILSREVDLIVLDK